MAIADVVLAPGSSSPSTISLPIAAVLTMHVGSVLVYYQSVDRMSTSEGGREEGTSR